MSDPDFTPKIQPPSEASVVDAATYRFRVQQLLDSIPREKLLIFHPSEPAAPDSAATFTAPDHDPGPPYINRSLRYDPPPSP